MALFKRKKTDTETPEAAMPEELQEYYQAETRERSWMAWVLGLATLVVTVVIALGLFYGGRYAYRKIRGNDQPASVQQENQPADEAENTENEAEGPSVTTSTTNTPAPAPASAPNTSSTNTATPRAATPQPTAMPSTGPADTIAIFMAVSVLAYAAHRRFLAN